MSLVPHYYVCVCVVCARFAHASVTYTLDVCACVCVCVCVCVCACGVSVSDNPRGLSDNPPAWVCVCPSLRLFVCLLCVCAVARLIFCARGSVHASICLMSLLCPAWVSSLCQSRYMRFAHGSSPLVSDCGIPKAQIWEYIRSRMCTCARAHIRTH